MAAPKMTAKVKQEKRAEYKAKQSGTSQPSDSSQPAAPAEAKAPRIAVETPADKKLYVHVENPDDHDKLTALKTICGQHSGVSEIILVLGEQKKSAIRLPFKVEAEDELIGKLVKLLGEDRVVLK